MTTDSVSADTPRTISELEEATATLRTKNTIRAQETERAAQHGTEGAQEQNLE